MRPLPTFPLRRWLGAALLALGLFLAGTEIYCAETLQKKQSRFTCYVSSLLLKAESLGYDVTLGEVWRSEEVASFQTKANAAKGIGIVNSLHRLRLAIDINLFKDGVFLTKPEDYKALGAFWKKLCSDCRWGGDFKRVDAVHFSVQHGNAQ